MSSGVSLTLCGKGASLALVSYPSSDGVTIKVTYGVDVLLQWPAFCTLSFLIRFAKTESNFIVRSVDTGLGR